MILEEVHLIPPQRSAIVRAFLLSAISREAYMIEYTGTGVVDHGPCFGRMYLHPTVPTVGDWPQTHAPYYDNPPLTLEDAYERLDEADDAEAIRNHLLVGGWPNV